MSIYLQQIVGEQNLFLSFVNNEAVTTLLHMQLVNSDLYAFLSNKVLKKDQEHILMAGMMLPQYWWNVRNASGC